MNEIQCQNKEVKCDQPARVLSYHDKPKVIKNGLVISYNRTNRWRCEAGHRFDTQSAISHKDKYPPPPLEEDDSPKRFHRPGFGGHRVNKPNNRLILPTRDPSLTNHQRLVARRAGR